MYGHRVLLAGAAGVAAAAFAAAWALMKPAAAPPGAPPTSAPAIARPPAATAHPPVRIIERGPSASSSRERLARESDTVSIGEVPEPAEEQISAAPKEKPAPRHRRHRKHNKIKPSEENSVRPTVETDAGQKADTAAGGGTPDASKVSGDN